MRATQRVKGIFSLSLRPRQLSEMKYKNNNRESVGMPVTSNAEEN